ncbi:hypothetical protein [Streptomyces lavendulae]|uniref:hypothetical protein n=1 Tax=Streptomyces lavendulae TaxID=1914 RepID=UPI0036A1F9CA
MNAARRSAGRVLLAARALLPALGAAALVGTVVAPASAAPIPVACSEAALNSAITTANSGGGTRALFPGCTYTLTAPLPTISANVVIEGRVATITRSATAPDFGILRVNNAGNLDIRNIIISNGAATAGGDFGGGIRNDGTLRVSQSIIKNNRAQFSGGIGNNSGTVTSTASVIAHNTPNNCVTSSPAVPQCLN